ncbi:MAG: hypothetical protein ACYCXW_24030 [Solirubrobacteraceae bacterium]
MNSLPRVNQMIDDERIGGRRGAAIRAIPAILLALMLAFAFASAANASDASFRRALAPYKTKLTTDIAYLSNFSAPSKRAAPSSLRTLSRISRDLAGATKAAKGQQGSTTSGRKGRSEVLSALSYATSATSYARSSATAARGGNRSRALAYARSEQARIDKAIPLFEDGGRRLHLF